VLGSSSPLSFLGVWSRIEKWGDDVAVLGLADSTRQRLLSLLADDRSQADRLMTRLRELRRLDEIPAFAATIHLLAHLELSDKVAEKLLEDILAHRHKMEGALGRDPGLRVAVIDFLSNIEQRLTNPMIVEMSQFEETERSAVTDSLTGLYNRRFFRTALEREVRRCRRYGLTLSLVMLDLDGFKDVNDEYGHLFGDLVLRRVSRFVRRAIRESDIACRFGGEEFTVVLPETDRLGAYAVAERIRRRVEWAFAARPTSGREVPMTLSGGIASYPEDGRDLEGLVGRADESLYRAKTLGKNRIALHFAERRSSVRYPARSSARVKLASDSRGPAVPALAVNLSSGGALVETPRPLRAMDPVRLHLGGGGYTGPRWVVRGRVVRVEPGRKDPRGYRVGIVFEQPLSETCLRAQTHPVGSAPRAASGG